jgi:Carboxypeptidase regulatory-like domain
MRIRVLHLAIAAIAILAVAGCGKSGTGESSAPLATIDSSTTGSITGAVTLDGAPPALKPIDMSASPACVQANPSPVVPPVVITGPGGSLANVVVYVKSGLGNYRYDTPQTTAILSQKNCMYEPHVLALMTNQPFAVENNDPTMHNVHPMPKQNRQWSNSQPAGSAPLKSNFTRPEFAMPVLCNVHPWMRAFVFVFDHPYFAVTSTAGTFELRNLPPGTYTIEAWQENYPAQDQSVTIGARESKNISFTFKSAAAPGD